MTEPVEPTAPPEVPYFPAVGESGFNAKAFNFGTKFPAVVAWITSAVANAWNNAKAAFENASAAQQSAIDATTAAGTALAASNFKDEWATLAARPNPADRVLNKPASVKDEGRFWALRNNLPDVALSKPSDSNPDWVSLDAGVIPTQRIATNTPAVAGVRYLIDASLVLTLPAVWTKGAYTGWRLKDGVTGASVVFGTTPLWGRTLDGGVLLLDAPFAPMDLNHEDNDWGLQ